VRFKKAPIVIIQRIHAISKTNWRGRISGHNFFLLPSYRTIKEQTQNQIFHRKSSIIYAEGVEPNQLSFNQASAYIIKELSILPAVPPGSTPKVIEHMNQMTKAFILPKRRERSCTREVRRRPTKYPFKKNANQLN
jgi:hypothetical protein